MSNNNYNDDFDFDSWVYVLIFGSTAVIALPLFIEFIISFFK